MPLSSGCEGDVVVVYRVVAEGDAIFRDELEDARAPGAARVHYVVGDHRTPGERGSSPRRTSGSSSPTSRSAMSTSAARLP